MPHWRALGLAALCVVTNRETIRSPPIRTSRLLSSPNEGKPRMRRRWGGWGGGGSNTACSALSCIAGLYRRGSFQRRMGRHSFEGSMCAGGSGLSFRAVLLLAPLTAVGPLAQMSETRGRCSALSALKKGLRELKTHRRLPPLGAEEGPGGGGGGKRNHCLPSPPSPSRASRASSIFPSVHRRRK